MRPAPEVNAAHRFDGQRDDVIDVALHDPFEAVANAEHVDPIEPGPNRRRPNHAVDARGRSSADENSERLVMFHLRWMPKPSSIHGKPTRVRSWANRPRPLSACHARFTRPSYTDRMSASVRRIGVLTGGGDAPGLNAVIRAVVKSAATAGHRMHRPRRQLRRPDLSRNDRALLTLRDVTGILRLGGTILGTTNRGNPFAYPVETADGPVDYSRPLHRELRRSWGSTRSSSSAATARSPSPTSSTSAASRSSACPRRSTTTSPRRR